MNAELSLFVTLISMAVVLMLLMPFFGWVWSKLWNFWQECISDDEDRPYGI